MLLAMLAATFPFRLAFGLGICNSHSLRYVDEHLHPLLHGWVCSGASRYTLYMMSDTFAVYLSHVLFTFSCMTGHNLVCRS